MDSENSSFPSGMAVSALVSVPPRHPVVMAPGMIVAWTPGRLVWALGAWLMEETQLPPGLAVTVKRRV